jgi:predicted LPLAT superfamily acyltransferase
MSSRLTTSDGHWASANEFSFLAGMRLLFWICRLFGRWPFRIVLYPVVLWYVLVNHSARAASKNYLQRMSNYTAINARWWNVVRHFAAFAETMLDKMLLWSGNFNLSKIKVVGLQQMEDCIQQGRGAVIICAHLGNLELCRVLSMQHSQLKLTVLVHTKHAKLFNELMGSINPASQMNLMQVTDMTPATAMLLSEKVAQGEFVVIAGDRIPVAPHPRVAMAPFLGQVAAFPIGPYVLASILQCPTYLLFSMRTSKDKAIHSEIHFELLRESIKLPRKGRDQMLAELVAEFAARLEHHCIQAPLQWFNFYNYWLLPSRDLSDAKH